MSNKLFSPIKAGSTEFKNRIAMAPMTRSRATSDNIPTDIMAGYYADRADAGLLITEGTSPSPNGVGYTRIPGIYNEAQIAGWKAVADAVHAENGRIFMQLMHTGRVSHEVNLPEGAKVVAPSAVAAKGQMYVDGQGMLDQPVPHALTTEEVESTIEEYVQAAKNAVAAGIDGVELHGANGYLIEQFINPHSNVRTDKFGGSIEGRTRFALEIAKRTVEAIGKDKVGIRFSPYGAFNDIAPYDEVDETYAYLAEELNKLGILYIHVLDHSSMGMPAVPQKVKDIVRDKFENILIFGGGFDKQSAEQTLESGKADMIAFGRQFLANPDLTRRFELDAELNQPDYGTFYSPGTKGYNDYPLLQK